MAKMISLDKFAKGALREQFNREMAKITTNIWDFNTSATSKRKMTITIDITPDEDRQIGDVEISTKTALCPVKAVKTKLVFGYNEVNREGECSEFNSEMLGQIDLEEFAKEAQIRTEEMENKVIDLRQKAN